MMEAINNIIPRLTKTSASLEYFSKGQLKTQLFNHIYQDVLSCILFFRELELPSQSRVGIIGTNCYEFVVIDLACLAEGLISVPFDLNGKYDYTDLKKEYALQAIFTNINLDFYNEPNVFPFDLILSKCVSCQYSIQPYKFKPDDILTVKFTSGSTQNLKSIEAKVKSANASIISVQKLFNHTSNDKILIFLPLSLLQQRYWIYSAILYNFDITITSPIAVIRAIRESKPTVVMGVPFFYENMKAKFLSRYYESFFNRMRLSLYKMVNKISLGWVANTLGYKPFKDFFGGNIRYLWSGSAPSDSETLLFYYQMGIPLFQGYGMNETCIVSKNCFQNNKIGSVGRLLPNIEIKFDKDGQIFIKNNNEVNNKYYKSSEEDNNSTFSGGYVITGDLGYIDKDGYLFVTGRRKNLLVLSSGKKIHPEKIENILLQSNLIANCMVISRNSPFLGALIQPSSMKVAEFELRAVIDKINDKLLPEERIFRFFSIKEPLTIKNGMLTSQYKLKRNSIIKKYVKDIELLFINK